MTSPISAEAFVAPIPERSPTDLLFEAIRVGDTEGVDQAIKAGAVLNEPIGVGYFQGATPIFAAAIIGNDKIVDLLIKAGASPTDPMGVGRHQGITPIYAAASKGKDKIVDLLIKAGASPTDPMGDGIIKGAVPIVTAALQGHDKVVDKLIEYGADINDALRICIATGKSDVVARAALMLLDKGADATTPNEEGISALDLARKKDPGLLVIMQKKINEIEIAQTNRWTQERSAFATAVARAANHFDTTMEVTQPRKVKKTSAGGGGASGALAPIPELSPIDLLFKAIRNNDNNGVDKALSEGADPNEPKKGMAPIFLATDMDRWFLVRLLIKGGANPNNSMGEGSSKGVTPIYMAAAMGHYYVVDELIRSGVSATEPMGEGTVKGLTPIVVAALNGHDKVVDKLIKNGADINDALRICIARGRDDLVIGAALMLLDKGADATIPNEQGRSALDLARGRSSELLLNIQEIMAVMEAQIEHKNMIFRLMRASIMFSGGEEAGASGALAPIPERSPIDLLCESFLRINTAEIEANSAGVEAGASGALAPIPERSPIDLLFEAIRNNDNSGVDKALSKGVDPNEPYKGEGVDEGVTPIFMAAVMGYDEVVDRLIAAGASPTDPMVSFGRGVTPIVVAALQGHDKVVDKLIENGADINDALRNCIVRGESDKVYGAARMLLNKGADATICDAEGRSALDLALEKNPNLWVSVRKEMLAIDRLKVPQNSWLMSAMPENDTEPARVAPRGGDVDSGAPAGAGAGGGSGLSYVDIEAARQAVREESIGRKV